MSLFTKNDIIVLFLGIAVMLGLGKLLGELFRRIKLPSVAGEILAGIILGPSLAGRIFPGFHEWLFPAGTRGAVALESFTLMGVVFLLLIAGVEIDLSSIWKQGKSVFILGLFNIALPFAAGFFFPVAFPGIFGVQKNPLLLPLFIGVSVSITALPVIAKILMEMNLIKSDFGMLVLAAAMLIDLFGWIIFSVIIQVTATGSVDLTTLATTIGYTLVFAALILTVLRYLINYLLPLVQARTEWPGGVIVFIVITGLIFSALTEAIGIHAIFGAFLAGIAIGDSPHLREHTKEIIHQFISNIFAPLFFVSIGLRMDFVGNFNPVLTVSLVLLAVISKIVASVAGGRLAGLTLEESLPVGAAMSTVGAMGIIIGLFALQHRVINDETFVAIVITALATSLLSPPLMKMFLKPRKIYTLTDLMDGRVYIPSLEKNTVRDAIMELSETAAPLTGLEATYIARRVLEREQLMGTGIGHNIAVPHARLDEIHKPLVVIGKSTGGIDFNSPDGEPAHLIFMILTPTHDQEAQIQILAQISHIFYSETLKKLALQAKNYVEFMSAVKSSNIPVK